LERRENGESSGSRYGLLRGTYTHPNRENVTVISGQLKVGMGDHFDTTKMMAFPPGSFAYLDPDMHHYAMADAATTI
jgi:hypothetical protein